MKLTANGYLQTTVVTGTTYTGLVAADGSTNIVIVPGTSVVGRYHACGALNAVVVSGTSPVGRVHACGAINVIIGSLPSSGVTHPSGALQVSNAVPTFVPSLDGIFADLTIDFNNKKAWIDNVETTPDALNMVQRSTSTSYARDSSGVYTAYSANTVRYDGILNGILIEETRTNLCLQSNDLSSASWAKPADVTITTNTQTDIFGTTLADTITCSGTGAGGMYQTITVTTSTAYTWSFYIKLGTLAQSDYKFAVYDASNAAFIGLNIVPSTLPTTSTWTKIEYTFTTPVDCTSIRVYPLRNNAAIAGTLYCCQCQLEAGSFSTSPIPTTTISASRAADILSYTLPAALQGLTAYSLAWEGLYFVNTPSGNQFATWLNDGTISNQITLYKPVSNLPTVARTPPGGGTASLVAVTPNISLRLAYAATDNDVALLQTGQAARTATGAGFPAGITKLNTGSYNAGSFPQNGICKSVSLWGSRRSNAAMAGWVG